MKKLFMVLWTAVVCVLFFPTAQAQTNILGAGATFPYPIYTKWADAYQQVTGIKINYQPLGSGGGIKQIQAKVVDFGASDKPLTTEELKASGLVQFPTLVGGVVPIINLPGTKDGQIKLNGSVLADIYLGKIKKWNDPKLQALNQGLTLPDQAITVVHRSDGSGTTFLFTHYLSKVSPQWNKQVGNDTAVSWSTGIGGKGNEGVASYVQRVKGSIGYVEFAYAQHNRITTLQLINASGKAVSASMESFQAAASNARWNASNDFSENLTDQPGPDTWPITGATFILLPSQPTNPEKTMAVLHFFAWSYANGREMAKSLNYVPLPQAAVTAIEEYWNSRIKDSAGKPLWNSGENHPLP